MKSFLLVLFSTALIAAESQYTLGEKIYNTTCISCHGVDGNSLNSIQLIVNPRNLSKSILTQEQSFKIIKKGAHYWGACADIMPAFETTYSDEELHAVNNFIHQKFNPNAVQRAKKALCTKRKYSGK